MSAIKEFEDLECWKEARKLVGLISKLIKGSKELNSDYIIRDQLWRACISVMNNIAEGFGRYSDKEFIRFLEISKSSCLECQSMLYILKDIEYVEDQKIEEIRTQSNSVKHLINGLIRYLRNKETT